MELTKDLQLRLTVGLDGELRQFTYEGVAFKITGKSTNVDLIKSYSMFHRCSQYVAEGSDGKDYEVYVYYYTGFEDCKQRAVVDAIRERM
jgi:hypothetical protein